MVSKAFCKILKHEAEKAGLPMDDEGYVPLVALLSIIEIPGGKVSVAEAEAVVATNEKQVSLCCVVMWGD